MKQTPWSSPSARSCKNRRKECNFAWEQCKLGDVYGHLYSGNTPSRKNSANFGGDTPWIRTADLNNGLIKSTTEFLTYEGIKQLKILPENTIVLAMYGGFNQIGRTGILGFPATINQALVALTPHKNINQFFAQSYLNRHIIDWRRVAASSRKDPNITKEDVEKSEFSFGSLEEQNRISKLISRLDHTITLHEEKKQQLKRLKSALLQKMFANKSGYPAVRFERFNDIWDQEKLSSLVRLRRGLTYSPDNVQDSGIRVLRSSNILDGQFVTTDDDIFVKSSVVNIPTIKSGDILITAANGSIKLVGKHAIISRISENTAVPGGFMLVGSSRIPDFVNSLFGTSWYQRFIRKYVTGGNGSIGNLKKNDLDKQYVMVPTTSEQEQIGEFLKKIDKLITNNQIKHDKLLELKESLLQNMFI
ncbi:restriction endonuclease subunit S [Lactobacillus delbrueckii subsp. allosunkii]|nr:restriction endonuclease subunit S [Lactobacillus delbrueckii]MCZ0776266.1 restriction endonuclease subunit S [Lactobacillus delbrueckii subsp. sunkii]